MSSKDINQFLMKSIVTEIQICIGNGLHPIICVLLGCVQRSIAKRLLQSETVISQKSNSFDPINYQMMNFLVYEALKQQSSLKIQVLPS
jgi:hypothetical protein